MIPPIPNLKEVLEASKSHSTRLYGWRKKHPITGLRSWHNGIDLSCTTGTPIFAPISGYLFKFDTDSKNGNYIKLRHPQHRTIRETVYVHLDSFSSIIKSGPEKVTINAGDVIGYVGSTGKSTGPHLHFIIRLNKIRFGGGRWRRDVDPLLYLEESLKTA